MNTVIKTTAKQLPCDGKRLTSLRTLLATTEADAFFLHTVPSVRYYSNFTGDSAYLLVEANQVTFFTDGRYITQAASEIPTDFALTEINAFADVGNFLAARNIKAVGVEEHTFSLAREQEFKKALPPLKIIFCQKQITTPRRQKDEQELAIIRQAIAIAEQGFSKAVTLIKPGIREMDIALELEYQMKQLGAERAAFDLIVASGFRSALPHGVASTKPIAPGDVITIDFGACYQGYHSDQTCTLFLGEPSKQQKQVYQTLLQAQQAGITAARPEMAAKELDRIVREMVQQAGYGDYFAHGTGHGTGLEIHEAPSISARSDQTLAAGMVFTIEPGCYFPHQWGIRLEEMVHLTGQGGQVMTTLDKRLDAAIIE
ncbi:MAG: aminopeptidase P family protein [Deltaproteobacteria bacterium]|nr:aminopeptidase P family protein [Candidatus Anaeroferrophillus wilburensis]MBN2889355.1 aminopeptidase P family protein [Deltaproteobacteria bacterium]